MKTSTARSCFFFALFPIIIVFLVLPVHAAEKKKFTLQTKPVANISKTTVYLEDKPKHKLTQDIELRTLISSNPDFNNLEVKHYGQSDSIAGTGSHRGYSFYYNKNGDKAYTKWEGTHKTTLKEDKSWETNVRGNIEFVGGTGMFNKIKGGGTYTCFDTAEGGGCKAEVEAEY
jgi:hypothetical protein